MVNLEKEIEFTIKVNVKKQRRFDRSTVIFKLKSKNFCMRLNIQSIMYNRLYKKIFTF